MKAIEFNNVHFSYTDENEDVFSSDSFCLHNVDFSVEEGEFVAVLGHNGSGKSTLARLTNGLLTPSAGTIKVFGEEVEEENLFDIRKQVGIVFQNPDNQTVASIVEDDIAFGPENIGVPREEIGARIDFALQAVGMEQYRNATPSRLSGGQKQRIAIAGVLALKPRIMILDESTAMLDPRGRKEVMDVILRLNKEEKITVVLITHFSEEALLADRAIVMNRGAIVMEGKPQEIFQRKEELERYQLKLPRGIRICRELAKNGLPVADSLSAEGVAENIVRALEDASLEAIAKEYTFSKDVLPYAIRNDKTQEDETGKGGVVCRDLNYVYNPHSPFETYALKGANLTIESGEFFGILGHTGSGKSTFVQHLNALLKLPCAEKKYKPSKKSPPITTKLVVNGYDLTDKNTDFKALRRKVGMVFQYPEYQLFAETVFEDVEFGLKNFAPEMTETERENAVKEALETVGLCYAEVKNKSPFDLSGGQKRRVAIAGVIVTKPEILVLDEPAAGLDPLGKEAVHDLLHKIHNGWCKTVIIVSHDMDEIAENCTKAAVFSDGEVLALDTPKNLFSETEMLDRAGLQQPFVAQTIAFLRQKGMGISCDFQIADFVENVLDFAKTKGAGMRSTKEGTENA